MAEPAPAERLLGFDFRLRSIGVAVGNRLTGTATPRGAVTARDGVPDWAALDRLLAEWRPDALVVGLPLNMDGSESPLSEAARRFSRRLSARYHLRAFMVDERLSTREASGRLDGGSSAAAGRPRTKAENDAAAACLILESWLRDAHD